MTRPGKRPAARAKILEAASAIAREIGPGQLSLDAVAARAGVSKGGLLYHFPTKAQLVRALVEGYLEEVQGLMKASEKRRSGTPHPVASACIHAFSAHCMQAAPPSAGVLAAIVESPDFIGPVREHNRAVVEGIRQTSPDPQLGLVAFLAIEGMRALQLFDTDPLTPSERKAVLAALLRLLAGSDGDHGTTDETPSGHGGATTRASA